MKKTAAAMAVLACALALECAGGRDCAAQPELRAPLKPERVQAGAAPLPERRLDEGEGAAEATPKSAEDEARIRAAEEERRARQEALRADIRRRMEEASRLAPGVQPDGSVVIKGADGSVRIMKRSAGPGVPAAPGAGKDAGPERKKH